MSNGDNVVPFENLYLVLVHMRNPTVKYAYLGLGVMLGY